MAKYVMVTQINGTRDGADWPKPGEPVDLPAHEVRTLLLAGIIREVPSKAARPEPEKATAPEPETRKRR